MNEYSSIQNFVRKLNSFIAKKEGLQFITDTYLEVENKTHIIDGVLIKNREALAVFNFKSGLKAIISKDFLFGRDLYEISHKFLVVTNGDFSRVLDRYTDEIHEFGNVKALVNFLTKLPTEAEVKEMSSSIAKAIESAVVDFLKKDSKFTASEKRLLINHFATNSILENLLFDFDGQFFHLSPDIRNLDNFENTFFRILIKEVKSGICIYRYTALDTVFATLNYKSIRLNGIAGMNDTSEIGYVETYIDKDFVPLQKPKEIEDLNKRFILCSSILNDDLMQWRLYGDDSKGACLVFKVSQENSLSGLQIHKISYGRKISGKNYHSELELIKAIVLAAKSLKHSFQFRGLNIWKHFFKSFEYEPEQEVRLLVILSSENSFKGEGLLVLDQRHNIQRSWVLTASHKILNPYITIPLDDFGLPLRLEKIILGPKCPELSTNQKQFGELIREKQLGIEVEISKINNYR